MIVICNATNSMSGRQCGYRSPDGLCQAGVITINTNGICRYISHPHSFALGDFTAPIPSDMIDVLGKKENVLNIVKREDQKEPQEETQEAPVEAPTEPQEAQNDPQEAPNEPSEDQKTDAQPAQPTPKKRTYKKRKKNH